MANASNQNDLAVWDGAPEMHGWGTGGCASFKGNPIPHPSQMCLWQRGEEEPPLNS